MRLTIKTLALIPAVALMAACSRGDKQMDDALKNDLALANQTQPNQVVSPLERGDTTKLVAGAPVRAGSNGPATTYRPAAHRTVVRHSSSSRSSGSSSGVSSGTVYTEQSSGGEKETRNTKRDAAVGAAAGAAIGAMTSKDKLKGGIIGAAAGGILGGIIGNNVDVKKHP